MQFDGEVEAYVICINKSLECCREGKGVGCEGSKFTMVGFMKKRS